jgi:hypothetical protein
MPLLLSDFVKLAVKCYGRCYMASPAPGEYQIVTDPIAAEHVPRAVFALQQLGVAFSVVSAGGGDVVNGEIISDELPPDAVSLIDSGAYPYNYDLGVELLELEPDEKFLLDCIVGSGLLGVRRKDVFRAGLGSNVAWKDQAKAYDKANRDLTSKLNACNVPFLVKPLGAKSARRYVCLVADVQ